MATIVKRTDNDGKTSYQVKVWLKGYPAQSSTFARHTGTPSYRALQNFWITANRLPRLPDD